MAQTIKLKRSATAGNEPALNQLELGEIAINTADGKMFIKRDNGTANDPTIVEVGSTASFLPLSGGTLTGNLNLGDNVKAQFGAGDDLEIFSNGSTALLKAGNATSDIRIESDNRIVIADRGFNEAFAVFNDDSDVKLYHDGSQKFATTSTGIDVTGNVSLPDNGKLQLGNQTNGDLQIYHDGSHSYIDEVGTGALIVRANYGLFVKKYSDNTQLLNARTDGAVELFHSGTERLSTTSTGIDVTGSVVADELTVDGTINAYRSGYTQGIQLLGDSGGNQVIGTATNDKSLIIKNLAATKGIEFVTTNKSLDIANNGDISFYDSSGTSQDLFWDSSASSLGIGTTSPSSFVESSRFVVGSGTSGINEMMFLYSGTNAFGAIGFADGTSGTSAYKGTIGYHHDTDEMFFSTNGGGEASRDFTISSSGNATFTGSVTAPTIKSTSHYEGTSYRIYNSTLSNYGRLTADSLGSVIMHTGAGEGARLTPTGLGIGTQVPTSRLHLKSASRGSIALRVTDSDTTNDILRSGSQPDGDGFLQLRTVAGAGNVLFDASGDSYVNGGNFGIGTSSPTDKLDVAGAIRLTSNISFDANKSGRIYKASNHGLAFHGVTGTENDFALFTSSGQLMVVNPTGTNNVALVPTAGGSVGIGTSSPSYALDVSGAAGDVVRFTGDANNSMRAYLGSGYQIFQCVNSGTTNQFGYGGGSFYVQTSGAERIRIFSGGNTSIGSSTDLGYKLNVVGNALFRTDSAATTFGNHSSSIRIQNKNTTDNNYAGIVFDGSTNAAGAIQFQYTDQSGSYGDICFETRGSGGYAERLRIDSSGRLLLGLSSATGYSADQDNFIIKGSAEVGMHIIGGTSSTTAINFGDGTDTAAYRGQINYHNADDSMRLNTAGSEAARLTSDGTLLVGKTSVDVATQGIVLRGGTGESYFSRTNDNPVYINRNTSDGGLISFRKDGTTVGSIGTFSQDSQSNFFIGFNNGSQDVGLGFGHSSGTGRAYYPCRDNGSGVSDAISLGTATYKYKDLYLSGNTQMGGNLDVVGQIGAYNNPSSSWGQMILRATDFVFKNAGGSIRASIDTSGNLLVGQTTNAETGTGIGLVPDGTSHMYSANTDALMLGRGGSDGEILSFNRSGVTKGNISVSAYGMGFGGGTRSSDFFIKTDGTASFASGVNLGVGTSSPSTNLHSNITSASGAFLTSSSVYALQLSNSDTSAGNAVAMSFGHGGFDYTNFIASVRTGTASNPKGDLVFGGRPSDGASFSERVRLTSGGNLLIGKTADDDSTVGIRMQSTGHTSIVKSGGNCLTLNRLSSDGSLLDFRKDTGTLVGSIESATNTTVDLSIGSGNVRLLFFTNGSAIVPRATSNNSANGTIDLGNSGNKFKDLYLSRRVNFGGVAGNHFAGYDGVTDCLQLAAKTFVRFQTGTNYDEAARLTSSNELLIGCTSAGDAGITLDGSPSSNSVPSMELVRDFSGTATMIRFTNISGSPYVGSISSTTSATAYNTSSDERLKDNIVDAPIASEDIDAIQVRSFDWKADGEHQKYGMVAQELLEVAPDAVTQGDTPDDMMGVDYSKLVPMLIKEIQSLRQRVAQLEE